MTYLITAALGLAAVAILAGMVWFIARDGGEPEHPGADDDYATEVHEMAVAGPAHAEPLTAETPAVYVSRHHEDTVEIVTGEYRPLYSRAFAAAVGCEEFGAAR
ncbi:hypothetical protein O7626_41085 [Micromonospora sp. WMMD1102]|uniref:hypothetical protein n=1 Tax=Micromonospora sp. WMMD1102 TaxID=3016105 RepID=UPI00241556ED|nr:hypothetical protein [Micromonospora sp. WMMD1102]MDG4784382.1 hypothetical protein [Micromonospora sp. WMMD1102]MDG4792200.1 hypothetical protein [Micromonospora sp. WMMD1102]